MSTYIDRPLREKGVELIATGRYGHALGIAFPIISIICPQQAQNPGTKDRRMFLLMVSSASECFVLSRDGGRAGDTGANSIHKLFLHLPCRTAFQFGPDRNLGFTATHPRVRDVPTSYVLLCSHCARGIAWRSRLTMS